MDREKYKISQEKTRFLRPRVFLPRYFSIMDEESSEFESLYPISRVCQWLKVFWIHRHWELTFSYQNIRFSSFLPFWISFKHRRAQNKSRCDWAAILSWRKDGKHGRARTAKRIIERTKRNRAVTQFETQPATFVQFCTGSIWKKAESPSDLLIRTGNTKIIKSKQNTK